MDLKVSSIGFKNQKAENNSAKVTTPLSFNKGGAPVLRSALSADTVSFTGTKSRVARGLADEVSKVIQRSEITGSSDKGKSQVLNFVDESIKKMESRADAVNLELAKRIHKESTPAYEYFKSIMNKYFSGLVSTDTNPDRPLAYGRSGLVTRHKKADSICEKTATRGFRNREEIKEGMGDIIAGKLVLRDASPKSVELVVSKVIEAVKNNELKIFEIEDYRLKSFDSYIPKKSMAKLVKECGKMRTNGVEVAERYIPSGYNGVHFGIYLPDGFKGEIQLFGIDVQRVKEIEDLIYKVKNNKSPGVKYKPIEELLSPIKNNKPLQKALNCHTIEQYVAARLKEPIGKKVPKGNKFLKAPDYLPQEFDFNDLYHMKLNCDRKATNTKNPNAS